MLPLLLSHKTLWTLTIGLLTAVPALPPACQASTNGTIGIDLPGITGTIEFEGQTPNKTMDVNNVPAVPCVEFKFTDAQGNTVGTWAGSVPAEDIPVPPDATDVSVGECEPEKEERSFAGPRGKLRRIDEWFFHGGPIEPKLLAGEVSYAVTISATSRARAEDLLEELLADARQGTAGLEALPRGVYRIHYLTNVRLVGVDMVFEFFDDDAFVRLDFSLNGVPETRTLDDAATFTVGGWHTALLTVPVVEFEAGATLGTTYHNDFAFDLSSGGEPCRISGFWDYTLQ